MNLKLNLSEESALWRPLFENNYDIMEKKESKRTKEVVLPHRGTSSGLEGDAKSKLNRKVFSAQLFAETDALLGNCFPPAAFVCIWSEAPKTSNIFRKTC